MSEWVDKNYEDFTNISNLLPILKLDGYVSEMQKAHFGLISLFC